MRQRKTRFAGVVWKPALSRWRHERRSHIIVLRNLVSFWLLSKRYYFLLRHVLAHNKL
jgi:hypothetical protein